MSPVECRLVLAIDNCGLPIVDWAKRLLLGRDISDLKVCIGSGPTGHPARQESFKAKLRPAAVE